MQVVRAGLVLVVGVVAVGSTVSDGVAQPKKDTVAPKVDLMAPYKPSCPASYSTRPPGSPTVIVTPGPFTLAVDASGVQDRCVGKRVPACAEGILTLDSAGSADACKTASSSKPPTCPAQGYALKVKVGADECEGGGAFVCPAEHKAVQRTGADLCLPIVTCGTGSALAADRVGTDDKCLSASAYACPTGHHVLVDPRDDSNTQIPPALRSNLTRDACEKNMATQRVSPVCGAGKVQYARAGADFCYAPAAPTSEPTCPAGLKLFREAGRDVCAPVAYGVTP